MKSKSKDNHINRSDYKSSFSVYFIAQAFETRNMKLEIWFEFEKLVQGHLSEPLRFKGKLVKHSNLNFDRLLHLAGNPSKLAFIGCIRIGEAIMNWSDLF